MLKTNAELKKLTETNPNSTDIYKKGPIDRYSDRPDELENFCLADYIALFTYHSKGRPSNETEDNVQDDVEDMAANMDENVEIDPMEKKRFE